MPPPQPQPQPQRRGKEPTGGMAPPERRMKAPLWGAGSSGVALMPQMKRRGSGTGSSLDSREKAAAAAPIGSSGGIPLKNLSNLIETPGFRGKERNTTPAAATSGTTQPRVTRERKYGRPWSSSSASMGTDPLLRSTKSLNRRYSLLSVNNVDSLTNPAADAGGSTTHFSNTASVISRESATRLRPVQKPATALSGRGMPPSPRSAVKGMPPSLRSAVKGMPPSPRSAVKGMPPSPRLAVKGMPPSPRSIGKAPRKHLAVTSFNVETPRKVLASTSLNVETPQKHLVVSSLNAGTPRKHRSVKGTNGETPKKHQAVTGSNGEMVQEHKAIAGSIGATAQKHRIKEKAGGGLREENMAHKSDRKERTGPSAQVRHLSGTRRADTITRDKKQPNGTLSFPRKSSLRAGQKLRRTSSGDGYPTADEIRQITEETILKLQEVELLILQLNELGVGEDINQEELQRYYEQLPCEPPRVDTSFQLDDEQIKKLQLHHVLCRIKYFKVTQQGHKDDMHDAELEYDYDLKEKLKIFLEDETKLEGDHILDNLHNEGLLAYIEKDDTFDWSFQYQTAAALDDYQRLVLHNRDGCEYVHWDDYRKYFHKYEIELEYLDFWQELTKQLKWIEDYTHFGCQTLEWERICSRGESQAIKIATGFPNITRRLAHAAYDDCICSMNLEIYSYRDLDGVYFEVWKRVTKLKKSFKEALDEVYKLNKFPLREDFIKNVLGSNGLGMEREFRSCTKGITEEVTEEKAQDLIAYAVTMLRRRPKFYAQYIKKKMEIARVIGIIPPLSP